VQFVFGDEGPAGDLRVHRRHARPDGQSATAAQHFPGLLQEPGNSPPAARYGWGSWIRTRINGVRVRGSTVELSPTGSPREKVSWAVRKFNVEALPGKVEASSAEALLKEL
jgi:hypothetical protein